MSDQFDTSPERQAYALVEQNGFKGRLALNASNIRLFVDNPYIIDLPEADRRELNKELVTPWNGELFYDDDDNLYMVKVGKDPATGKITYTYISKTKEAYDKLNYYETQGVLNQLVSAYNNGQVYKFFYNNSTLMMYPNTTLVFPSNYASYTVRKQELNNNSGFIYVAGNLEDGVVLDTHIGMKTINDTATGTSYSRMGAAKVFNNSNPDKQYDIIVNGEFYVIDFYDINGSIIDTKLFQAVEALVTDTQMPTSSIIGLKIEVFRNNIETKSANNIYGIFAGEDLIKTVSFSIFAIYNDGVVKNITNLLDTAHLSRDGWDVNTSGAATGDQFEVTFTYWPDIDEDGNSVGPGIKESVFFQVVANDYSKLYKILPVMWSDNNTDMNISSATNVKVYKLKVYTLDQNGVLENRSRAFYDTMKAVKGTNADELTDFEDCPYTYDPYQMCVIFSFPASSIGTDTAFDFQLYNASQLTHYRFICKFGVSIKDAAGVLINGYSATTGSWGYEDGGVLSTLNDTYHYEANGKANLAKLSLAQDGGFNITINSWNGEYFQDRYKRSISGEYYKPVKVQLFAVKDSTSTPLTSIYQYSRTATSVMVPTYKDTVVSDIIMNLRSYDYILAKFIYTSDSENILINVDVFNVSRVNV